MKYKIIVLCALLTAIPMHGNAQKSASDSLFTNVLGVKLGINLPSLYYSSATLNAYKSSILLRPIFGAFFETEITNTISFRPEIVLIGKGQKINDIGVTYQITPNYVEFRTPFIFTYKQLSSIQPYLMVGPTFGFATGGKIQLDNYKLDINKSNIAPTDYGIIGGIGAKLPVIMNNLSFILSGEIDYSLGLSNTFSKYEINETAIALNEDTYTIDGSRKNRGLSISISFGFPLRNLYSKQAHKNKNNEEKTSIPEKNSYTIDEILAYLKEGDNVANKKICMFNVRFETGKSALDPESVAYLTKLVGLLNDYKAIKLQINGYTDNVGTEQYNLQLSERRALAVYMYLIKEGISKNRLTYAYYGTHNPIATNETDEGRALNRRVEFEIKY